MRLRDRLELVFADFEDQQYQKGDIVLRPGEQVSHLYLLRQGAVRQYVRVGEGEVTIHIYREGAVVPLALVLAGVKNRFYFEAMGPVTVRRTAVGVGLRKIEDDEMVLKELLRRFAQATLGLATRIEYVLGERSGRRVAGLLVYLAERFGEKRGGKTVIKLALTQREIASWVGLARETVSRELKRLKAKGLIVDHKTIINLAKLKRVME